jgi:hypothetical protein
VEILGDPFTGHLRFNWRFDATATHSHIVWDDGRCLADTDIHGVLVRHAGWVDRGNLTEDDWRYLQSESQAALVAWLHSLRCPVVNLYPPDLWYRPTVPLLYWHRLLRAAGLAPAETFITNNAAALGALKQRMSERAVYTPLTAQTQYLARGEEEWQGLERIQDRVPVCLTLPHGAPHLACIVGKSVVWETAPPEASALESAFRRFAGLAGLDFVGVAVADTAAGTRVIAVDHFPRVDLFGERAQREIAGQLSGLLGAAPAALATGLGRHGGTK